MLKFGNGSPFPKHYSTNLKNKSQGVLSKKFATAKLQKKMKGAIPASKADYSSTLLTIAK